MDLKIYYQKIRDAEASIHDTFPIVASLDTADGGMAGRFAEVTRPVAAKLVADGMARVANAQETDAYRAAQAKARLDAEEAAKAQSLQVKVVSLSDYALLGQLKGEKE